MFLRIIKDRAVLIRIDNCPYEIEKLKRQEISFIKASKFNLIITKILF